jgi:phosphohistidine phosphatase
MKRLYLIRHAKSSWKESGVDDIDRPLNKRGKRDASFMGQRLKKYGMSPDLILSSPAKRALRTARIIAKELGYPKENIETRDAIYLQGISAILQEIHTLDDNHDTVMLFGHNPDFTILAKHLTDYQVDNIPTCGIFCVDVNVDSWSDVTEDRGDFVFFDYPKKHRDDE